MTPERFAKAVQVLNYRQPDLTVVTDQVHKGQNLSAIIRTCDAVGIMALHSVYDAATFKAHTGTTMGTHKWVETKVFRDINTPLKSLKNDNYQIVAADTSGSTKDYRDIDYSVPTALLLGAEKYGISDAAYPYIDQCITVPMMGMVESFNVSVACAIILAEARRQREVVGLYAKRQISDELFNRTILEWTQPLVARYCQKNDIKYPELDGKGDIIDPSWRSI
ncbi:tRNA (guanosine(18)-2'-O)-methyltransferase TrmH [Gammaproteobacteria bacterium]|nr:tRNA (guanosine(18)-2'-O)-methyltransferase TrmH [Gammaproteobacteria bacterium]